MRVVVAALCALAVNAVVPADKVTTIPGFSNPAGGSAPLSDLYSGYVNAGSGKYHHYVYSASLNQPTTDPVVLWSNGGPGCSSLEGAFSESGLYHIQEYSSPVTVGINPFSWNNVSNNLFFESPAGVGFSYCQTNAGCDHTDTSTAKDNLAAVISFFAAYPELAGNDFWIAGESYAGIYIPMLAYNIFQYNKNASNPINLKGILVGNGCIGNAAGHCGTDSTNDYHDIQQWKGHGLISETLYDDIMNVCVWGNENIECTVLLTLASLSIADIDTYYLYNTCSDPAVPLRAPLGNNSLLGRARASSRKAAPHNGLSLDPNCFGSGPTLETYFNQPEVKAAFNVNPNIDWQLCSGNFSFVYNSDMSGLYLEGH